MATFAIGIVVYTANRRCTLHSIATDSCRRYSVEIAVTNYTSCRQIIDFAWKGMATGYRSVLYFTSRNRSSIDNTCYTSGAGNTTFISICSCAING